jgi:hypothetical protein
MFRAPAPVYLDKERAVLIDMVPGYPALLERLRYLGLLANESHTTTVEKNLIVRAARSRERKVHHLSYMGDSAIYINVGRCRMLKITGENIEEVPVGTDDVVLIDTDGIKWPSLKKLRDHIDELQPSIGRTCTKLRPDLPLTQLLTTRWSKQSSTTPEQAH